MVIGYTLLGFLGYQLYLIAIGMTANESSKWRALGKDLQRQAAFDGEETDMDLMPPNAYDLGLLANFWDVIAARSGRTHAKQT